MALIPAVCPQCGGFLDYLYCTNTWHSTSQHEANQARLKENFLKSLKEWLR